MLLTRKLSRQSILTITFLFFLIITIIVRYIIQGSIFEIALWDEGWYRHIIENGYTLGSEISMQSSIAFFPLYPLICKLIKMALPFLGTLSIMLFVSWTCAYLAIRYLYAIVKFYFDANIALGSVILFLCFPFSFYIFQGYTEALWFAEAFSFLYFLKVRKYKILPLVIVGFSSATRLYGILLILLYIHEHLEFKSKSLLNLAIALPIGTFGLCSFCLYQYYFFGDPFLFFDNQIAWGHTSANNILSLLKLKQIGILAAKLDLQNPYSLTSCMFLVGFISTVCSKRMPKTFSAFGWIYLSFFFFVYNPDCMDSTGRYLSLLFPIPLFISYSLLGRQENKDNFHFYRFVTASLLLLSININLLEKFCHNIFVG